MILVVDATGTLRSITTRRLLEQGRNVRVVVEQVRGRFRVDARDRRLKTDH